MLLEVINYKKPSCR